MLNRKNKSCGGINFYGKEFHQNWRDVKMIQLFAKTYDLIQTEGKTVDYQPLDACSDPDEYGKTHYMEWYEDIKGNGIKYALKVHPDGHIADGNFRYWCARRLVEEGFHSFKFVPIDFDFFTGIKHESQYFTVRKEFIENASWDFTQKMKIIPNYKQPHLNKEILGHGVNLFAGIPSRMLTLLENKSQL